MSASDVDIFIYSASRSIISRFDSIQFPGLCLLLRQDYLVNQVIDHKTNQAFFVAVKVSPYRIITTNTATSECNIHGNNLSLNEAIVM